MSFTRQDIGGSPSRPDYVFDPKEDITTYELAKLLPFFSAAWRAVDVDVYKVQRGKVPSEAFDQIPEDLRRHFKPN
jgi:hypothetical protein